MELDGIKIRKYKSADAPSAAKVYRDSVKETGIERYSRGQVEVWASFADETEAFTNMLESGYTLVAESPDGIAAFGALNPLNHVALLYTLKSHSRRGVASAIYRELERHAASKGVTALTTDASMVSEPFFRKMGFRLIERERALRKGVEFERCRMKKEIRPAETKRR